MYFMHFILTQRLSSKFQTESNKYKMSAQRMCKNMYVGWFSMNHFLSLDVSCAM